MSEPSPALETLVDLVAGSIGGAVGNLVGHPMDVIKVRMMNSTTYSSMMDCAVKTWQGEGFVGFTRGIVPPLVSMMAYQSVIFAAFHSALHSLTDQPEDKASLSSVFLAGSAAGAATVVVTCPTELIKIRLQLTTEGSAKPLTDMMVCAKDVLRTDGAAGLYRGYTATLVRDTPSGGVYFIVYHGCKRGLDGFESFRNNLVAQELIAGGFAGMFSWGSIIPLDVVKTRMQAVGNQHTTMTGCFAHILRTEGPSSLFRGGGPLLLRAFPVNAVTFWSYEESARLLRRVARLGPEQQTCA